jgi:RNA polymerase sigma-70 factor, ECF subfamily
VSFATIASYTWMAARNCLISSWSSLRALPYPSWLLRADYAVAQLLVEEWQLGAEIDEAGGRVDERRIRRVAKDRARQLRLERPGHSLQPTALVHEVYLRLRSQRQEFQDKAHVCGVAAGLMRLVLMDHARRREAAGRAIETHLELEIAQAGGARTVDIVVLDDALTRLAAVDPALVKVVELRFFAGLSVEEAAEVLNVSPATVKRSWKLAKAWLYRELG